jgi:hypothetical protein
MKRFVKLLGFIVVTAVLVFGVVSCDNDGGGGGGGNPDGVNSNNSSAVGTWVGSGLYDNGSRWTESITFYADGTFFSSKGGGNEVRGSYSESDGKITITDSDGWQRTATINGNTMIVDYGGGYRVPYTKQ